MDDAHDTARIDDGNARGATATTNEAPVVDALVVQNCECLRS